MLAGEEVGDIFRGGRAYDTVVWSVPSARDGVGAVESLMLDTPTGQRVRMADVATITVRPTPNSIEREDGSRRLDVGTNVAGRDLASVADDLDDRLGQVDFPRGYHAEILGEYEERQDAQSRLLTTAVIALGLILLLRRPRAEGRPRTAGADPHDLPGDRAGAGAARRPR
jgi:Cu/Ag efflux pump CusA